MLQPTRKQNLEKLIKAELKAMWRLSANLHLIMEHYGLKALEADRITATAN